MSDDRHDAVRRRAYELWEQQGGGHGRDEEHWHQARRDVEGDGAAADAAADGAQAATEPAPVVAAPDGTTMTDAAAPMKPTRKRAAAKPKAEPATKPARKPAAKK